MEYYRNRIRLDNASVAKTVGEATEKYTAALGKAAMPGPSFRIAFEELLLQFRDCYGEECDCQIVCSRFHRRCRIFVSARGPRKDFAPYDESLSYSYDILGRLGVYPQYTYFRGKNCVTWEMQPVKPKNAMIVSILIAVGLAIFVGLHLNGAPESFRIAVTGDILNPVFNKIIAILTELATPLVFLAVIDGIVGIGDVKSFGRIGKKVLIRMLMGYLIIMALCFIGCVFVYGIDLNGASGSEASAVGAILKLVLDIIPDNLIQPFTIDNDLQVISIAIMFGIVLLMLRERVPRLIEFIKECAAFINKMMSLCCKLLPAVVFLGVTGLICGSSASQLANIGTMFLIFIIVSLAFVLLMVLRCAVVTKEPLKHIIPKQLSTLLINITTSSQVAALPENMKCCKEGFGVDPQLTDFVLPLGMVTYMPCGAVFLGLSAWGLCAAFGVSITLSIALRIVFIAIVLAIAAPPIPGSAFVVLPILFTSCAIPSEAFPIALIFGTIAGYVLPALNGFVLQLELLMTAVKLDKVDRARLRTNAPEKPAADA